MRWSGLVEVNELTVPQTKRPVQRFDQLDSLRGLAAVTVVIHHLLYALPEISDPGHAADLWILKYTPLHVFWVGRESVLFFFVLSGFVLSLPFYREPPSYVAFLIKRVCRIYIPYYLAVALGTGLYLLVGGHRVVGLSQWLNLPWSIPVSLKLLVKHAVLVDNFANWDIVPVFWSLVHEMRVSLMFPLIALAVKRYDWKPALALSMAIGAAGLGLTILADQRGLGQDYTETLEFTSMFVVGAVLAKYRLGLAGTYGRLSNRGRGLALFGALLLYTARWWALAPFSSFGVLFVEDVCVTVAVCIAIVCALASSRAKSALLWKPIHWIGRASYSIYLFHAAILVGLSHLLFGTVPYAAIAMMTLVLTFGLSALSLHYVERASVQVGRRLAERLASRTLNPAHVPLTVQ